MEPDESYLGFGISILAVGALLLVPGWAAWSGRWRRWAHPRSGWGAHPLVLFYAGCGGVGLGIFSLLLGPAQRIDDEAPLPILLASFLFVAALLLVVVVGAVLFFGGLFFLCTTFRLGRLPRWARPRWLPPDWEVPTRETKFWHVIYGMVTAGQLRRNPLPKSSYELGDKAAGHGEPLARARAYLWDLDGWDPEPVLQINPSVRTGRLSLLPDVLVFAQEAREDAVRKEPLVIAIRKDGLRELAILPPARQGLYGIPLWLDSRRRRRRRLMARTASDRYEFIVGERGESAGFLDQVLRTLKPSSVTP